MTPAVRTGIGGGVDLAQLARELTFVGGKGGVGKTTVSCAIAIAAADAGLPTLLVSTDPAPSIADALMQPIGDVDTPVDDVPRLHARQMDATAAFARFRSDYESRIDSVFDALMSRGLAVAHDRAIMRELLALAPPGIDEVYALSSLADIIAEGRFARVIVDPAPTGHLLRLLEMPTLALEWTHQLMRLMLKYKEVAPLGDAAQELLEFAKRTRALDESLHDRTRAGLVLVTLDEPLVRGESVRLASAVAEREVDLIAIIWNRADATPSPLPGRSPATQLCAPVATSASPATGVSAIRAWSQSWRTLSIAPALHSTDG
jgi:arsenite-transporting ATPase